MKNAWVLQLKPEVAKDQYEGKAMYLTDEEGIDFLTEDLQKADLIFNKVAEIEWQKAHEKNIFERFGADAICDFGYTNISKNFDWVSVDVEESQ